MAAITIGAFGGASMSVSLYWYDVIPLPLGEGFHGGGLH